jgi:hypothetical protein
VADPGRVRQEGEALPARPVSAATFPRDCVVTDIVPAQLSCPCY